MEFFVMTFLINLRMILSTMTWTLQERVERSVKDIV